MALAYFASASFYTETAPYQNFGEIYGFKILKLNPSETKLVDCGVKANDIVLAVNDIMIHTAKDAEKVYYTPKIKAVTVLRENRVVRLVGENR